MRQIDAKRQDESVNGFEPDSGKEAVASRYESLVRRPDSVHSRSALRIGVGQPLRADSDVGCPSCIVVSKSRAWNVTSR